MHNNDNSSFNSTKIIIFIIIGGILVVLSDLFVFGGIKNISYNTNDDLVDVAMLRKQHELYMNEGIYIDPEMLAFAPPPIEKITANNKIVQEQEEEMPVTIDEILAAQKAKDLAKIAPALGIEKEAEADFTKERAFVDILNEAQELGVNIPHIEEEKTQLYEYKEPEGKGMIAIIIDDMGISLRSKLVEILPAPLTLSYLPYAKNLQERTARAVQNGHEIMVHMPMEPMSEYMDTGPKVLSSSQNDAEFGETLDWGLSQFDGFIGINNHMGSKLTQDKEAMRRVMDYLKEKDKNLFFVDSKTISSSIAADIARKAGIPYAERDIFLDHEQTPEFIAKALKQLEEIAGSRGYAIAIGHPHKETIAALKAWIPTLKDKGLTLVPISKLIKQPKAVDSAMVAGKQLLHH